MFQREIVLAQEAFCFVERRMPAIAVAPRRSQRREGAPSSLLYLLLLGLVALASGAETPPTALHRKAGRGGQRVDGQGTSDVTASQSYPRPTPAKVTPCIRTNSSSIGIAGEIGDFVEVVRSHLHFRRNARSLLEIKIPNASASSTADSSSNANVSPLSELASIVHGDILAKLSVDPPLDMLEHLLCSLESTPPDSDNWQIFQQRIEESRSVVKQYRQSFVSVAILGSLLMTGSENIGASGFEISERALRRATKLAQERIGDLKKLIVAAKAVENHEERGSSASADSGITNSDVDRSHTTTGELISMAWIHEYVRREVQIFGRVHNLLGRLQFHHSQFEASSTALEAAVAIDPRVPEAYEWLARAYDRTQRPNDFFSAWHKALTVDPWASDRNVWPVFCVTISHPSVQDTPRLSINRERARVQELAQEEQSRLHVLHRHASHKSGMQAPNRYDKLMEVITAIRELECTPQFVGDRNKAMHDYHEEMKASNPQRDYSYINFAYGMVFYHGFDRLFQNIPVAREAIARTRIRGLDWVSFGSNVGTETLYAAITWGVKSTGYDVLCNLVSYANDFRDMFNINLADFFCKDALDADLKNAGIVWIDNQSWDEHLTNAVFSKLNRDLPPGAIVIEYAVSDFHAGAKLYVGNRLDVVGCATLDVSWDNNHGTTVTIFKKRQNDFSGNYFDWGDYGHLVQSHLKSIRRMVNMVKEEVEKQHGNSAKFLMRSKHENPLHGPLAIKTRQATLNENSNDMKKSRYRDRFNPEAELLEIEAATREDASVLTLKPWTDRVLSLFARTLFNWYCIFYYDLHSQFSDAEIQYFETFAALHGNEFRAYNLDGSWVGNRMSSYSYSHQLDTSDLGFGYNVGRIRIGTTINFHEMWSAARRVLNERGIVLPPELGPEFDVSSNAEGGTNADFSFHGLGWDMETKDVKAGAKMKADIKFKVFLMYHGIEALEKNTAWLDILEAGVEAMSLEHGLVSLVYSSDNENIHNGILGEEESTNFDEKVKSQVEETRVIVYPKSVKDTREAGLDAPAYTGTIALMFSSSRGMIPLFDLERNRLCAWRSQLPKNGQEIIDKWSAVGLSLETVSYVTATRYNLYFPTA